MSRKFAPDQWRWDHYVTPRQSGLRAWQFKQRREGGWWVVLAVVLCAVVGFVVADRPL